MSEENSVVTEKPRKKKRSLWWIWFLLILVAFAAGAVVGLKLNTLPLPNEMRDKLYPVLESYIPGSTAVHTPAAETPAPEPTLEPVETPEQTAEPEPVAAPEPTAEPEPAQTPEPTAEPELLVIPETPATFILPETPSTTIEPESGAEAEAIEETAAPEETAVPERSMDTEALAVSDAASFASEEQNVKYIGVNAAVEAALSHADIAEKDAEITGVVRTRDEDGKAVYRVSFSVGDINYTYTVDAVTAEIDGFQMSGMTFSDTAAFAASFTGDAVTESEATEAPSDTISEERAMEIAYKHASVKAGEVIRVTVETKTDTENNDAEFYHLVFKTATKSFEYDIDLNSGEILSFVKN